MTYPSFVEERINDAEIVHGSVGGPMFSTQITRTYGGQEQRNVTWDESQWRGELGQRTLTQKQMDVLTAFFRARKGKAIGFRHKDWSDHTATGIEGTLVALSSTSNRYQLYKTYATAGGTSDVRKIVKPVSGTVQVLRADTRAVLPSTVDCTTGILTLLTAPPSALIWIGEFDVPVRFDVDELISTFMAYDPVTKQRLHQVGSLPIRGLML